MSKFVMFDKKDVHFLIYAFLAMPMARECNNQRYFCTQSYPDGTFASEYGHHSSTVSFLVTADGEILHFLDCKSFGDREPLNFIIVIIIIYSHRR